VVLSYTAKSDYGIIYKTFTVHKKIHQIDLNLSIEPKVENLVARIFFSAPHMEGVARDVTSAIGIDEAGVFTKQSQSSLPLNQGWLKPSLFGCDTRYMIHAMVDDTDAFAQRAYYKHADNKLFTVLESESVAKTSEWNLSFYFGPKETDAVSPVDDRLEQTFEYSGYLAPISKILLKMLNFLYRYVRNYGLAIILLTVLIKLMLLPFTIKSEVGMKDRVDMQKKLQYLQKKYKNDPEMLARERAELIRKHGMPGLGGCLPLLLQIPVFFALSRVLSNSIELYHAPMLWIPDLSASDPYYILPICVTLAMLAQAATTDSQQRMSVIAMAFVFGAFTASFSAGLALYICVSTILGVLQTRFVKYLNSAK
jgi:YidC/Oxa1 family membrane protein insertase